jgi:hypothetical protein
MAKARSDLPGVSSKKKSRERDKSTRLANHFWFSEIVSSPKIKNIPLHISGNQNYNCGHPRPTRGAVRGRHET